MFRCALNGQPDRVQLSATADIFVEDKVSQTSCDLLHDRENKKINIAVEQRNFQSTRFAKRVVSESVERTTRCVYQLPG